MRTEKDDRRLYNDHTFFDEMKAGPQKLAYAECAIKEADACKDDKERFYWRIDYISELYFYGDMVKCIPAADELSRIFEEKLCAGDRYGYEEREVFADIYVLAIDMAIGAACSVPQISMQKLDELHAHYDKAIRKFGIPKRNYWWSRVLQWKYADIEKALEYLEKGNAEEPDYELWDCKACERTRTIELYLLAGRRKEADALAMPVLKHELNLVCKDTFPQLWSLYSKEELLHGNREAAFTYADKLYRKREKTQGDLGYMGLVLRCFALVNTDRALTVFIRFLPWTFDMWDGRKLYEFYAGAWVLFCVLEGQSPTIKMNLPPKFELWQEDGVYETSRLKEWYYKKASELAAAFDRRNGSDYFMRDLHCTNENNLLY